MSKTSASALSLVTAIIFGLLVGRYISPVSPELAITLCVAGGIFFGLYAAEFYMKYSNLALVKIKSSRK